MDLASLLSSLTTAPPAAHTVPVCAGCEAVIMGSSMGAVQAQRCCCCTAAAGSHQLLSTHVR